ncbi:DUF5667 domain-containing protein [Blastococcus sp. KM273129]|uniref:DUF5667 domain-containing protein n=1 Tax=Blastococcus sp. KM273129 TaxID=2570315 RepID=UPI001F402EA4|nr:DUF5667 domain-containing protein [Blastococcus sp. KM273129]MCF6736636.1 hypothetical protein [Blastococcus sp. KM273129]
MIRPEDGSTPTGPDTGTAVIARLESLADQLDTGPDPQFRSRSRARLVAMAAVRTPEPAPRSLRHRLLAARAVDRPPSRWRGRITAGLAGAAVGVTGLAALVAVAAGAQPGDPLYDLKRGTEQTQLALAGDSRGQTLLELAGTRLEELALLVGTGDPVLVERTLRTMDEHTTQAVGWLTAQAVRSVDTAPLEVLSRWTAGQSGGLAALAGEVPAGAAPAYARSTDLLGTLATRVEELRGALRCPTGPAVAGDDALGPVPGICLADTPVAVVEEPPGTVPPVAGTPADVPPSAGPSTPPVPAAPPASGSPPAGEPQRPGPDVRTGSPTPTPRTLPRPPVPDLPQPERPVTGPSASTPPPVVAVPLPGPLEVCLPPLITVGEC